MTTTTIKTFALFGIIIVTNLTAFSQQKDFGMWGGVEMSHKLSKKWTVEVNTCLRTSGNASTIDLFYAETGLSHKFGKYLEASAYYRLIRKNEYPAGYFNRYRWYADVKSGFSIKRIKLNTRLRFQEQRKTYIENLSDKLPDHYLRVKEKLSYNWPSSPVNPFFSAEYYFPLRAGEHIVTDKKRLSAGINYNLRKKQHIEVEYIYDYDTLPIRAEMYILSLSYQVEL